MDPNKTPFAETIAPVVEKLTPLAKFKNFGTKTIAAIAANKVRSAGIAAFIIIAIVIIIVGVLYKMGKLDGVSSKFKLPTKSKSKETLTSGAKTANQEVPPEDESANQDVINSTQQMAQSINQTRPPEMIGNSDG